jgi:nicotinamide-nucleotide amidase
MMQNGLYELAERLGALLRARGHRLALAESCTGGWIAQSVTAVPGSSHWFDRGFVTYSNAAKIQMLGVGEKTLQNHGAVSAETAKEMALGALQRSGADVALAVTGIAGPDGGTAEKPVGLVFLAWQVKGRECRCIEQRFSGNRQEIRLQTVWNGFQCLLDEYDAIMQCA